MMDLLNSFLNFVVPPASLVMLAFSWPALCFISGCEWLYNMFNGEIMEDKVVIITGASSGIGEQIAYEYAKRRAWLVLVARRENRLRGISENARFLGAKHVLIIAADVVKEEDCRRFINETMNLYGRASNMLQSIDGMLTRGEEGISKKKWFLSIVHPFSHSSDGNPNDSEPLCSKATLTVSSWKSALPDENNVLIQQTNWALVIPVPLDKSLAFRLLLVDLFNFILLPNIHLFAAVLLNIHICCSSWMLRPEHQSEEGC